MILSISSRCHYGCEHCYEGENLNAKEHLSYNDLSCTLEDAMQIGLRHMQLGGGEPMLRFDDMIKLIGQANVKIEIWLSTPRYGLTKEHAKILKSAGLTGATISLDHWDKEQHNRFRHHSDAYDWVIKAINNCNDAGIITNLTLCVTREMASERDLRKYMEIAREHRVPFVRFLEARKAGNYAGKDILLRKQEQATVLNFYLRLNSEKRYRFYPIIQYPGYHQRKLGCFGAGNRYLHIDTMGTFSATYKHYQLTEENDTTLWDYQGNVPSGSHSTAPTKGMSTISYKPSCLRLHFSKSGSPLLFPTYFRCTGYSYFLLPC